jgi:hypothetical protein
MARAVLHLRLLLRPVRPLEQALDVGHQALLVQLPSPLHRQRHLVVLHGGDELLLVNKFRCRASVRP